MNKKGQAAMEFLMTYGWAILAAIIAIAVLAYFGVFNPGRYTSEMCQVSAPFTCDDNSVAKTSTGVSIIVRNGGDENFNLKSINIQNCVEAIDEDDVPIASGATATITAACSPALVTGAAFRGNIEIIYERTGGTRDLTATGSITRKKVIA